MKLLYDVLRTTPSRLWAAHIRVGITSVLQNRIGVLYVSLCLSCLNVYYFFLGSYVWLLTNHAFI